MEKPLEAFTKLAKTKDGLSGKCRECVSEVSRRYYAKNKSKVQAYKQEYSASRREILAGKTRVFQQKQKIKVMNHYGNGDPHCVGCGIQNIEALTIDHIEEDGAAHRKGLTTSLYNWLAKNEFPDGFQILCFTCNQVKHKHQSVPVYTYKEGFTPSIQYPKEF